MMMASFADIKWTDLEEAVPLSSRLFYGLVLQYFQWDRCWFHFLRISESSERKSQRSVSDHLGRQCVVYPKLCHFGFDQLSL